MIFVRILSTVISAVFAFFVTAIIADHVIFNILDLAQNSVIFYIILALSIPAGLVLGWLFLSKFVIQIVSEIGTRKARFKAVLAILFVSYYASIIWL